MATLPLFDLILERGVLLAGEVASGPAFPEEKATKGLYAISIIVVIPLLIALFFLLRFLYRNILAKKLKTLSDSDLNMVKKSLDIITSAMNIKQVDASAYPEPFL